MSASSPTFDTIIIGAGIAGLSTALSLRRQQLNVIVLERSPALRTIGGGIQLRPNAGRVFESYGLREALDERSDGEGDKYLLRRWEDASVLTEVKVQDDEKIYGKPTWIMSRGVLQEVLTKEAEKRGVRLRYSVDIEVIDQASGTVCLHGGEELVADLIVGADGIHSQVRAAILPEDSITCRDVLSSYYVEVARSAILERSDSASPPEVLSLRNAEFALGPGRLVLRGILDHGNRVFWLLLTDKILGTSGVWDRHGRIEEAQREFSDFHESVISDLRYARDEECFIWRLADLPPLPSWRSQSGKVVLIGDAAHAILPTGGQGAAMAVEDSAALGECLARARSAADIPKLLEIFESVRKPRCEWMCRFARGRKEMFIMPDGETQQRRDAMMKFMTQPEWDGKMISDPPELSGPAQEHYTRAYDVFADTNAKLDQALGCNFRKS